MKHRARRGLRVADLKNAPAYVALIPLVAVFVTSLSFLSGRSLPALLVLAGCGALLMFIRPRYAFIAMVVFWAGSISIPEQILRLGPLKVTLGDLCFAVGVAGLLWERVRQPHRARPSERPRFTVPIAVFLVALGWGLLVATRAGNSLGESFHSGLNCLPLLSYFFIREVYAGRSRVLFQDLVVVTGALSAVTLSAIIVGFEPLIGRSENSIQTRGMSFDAVRIDPPLLRLMCITLLLVAFVKIPKPGRFGWVRWPIILAMLAVQAYSMTRTTWAPLLLAWLALPLLIWGVTAVPRVLGRGVAMGLVLTVGLGVASTGALGPTADAMAVRALSVTDDNITADPSLQDRLVENQQALDHIQQHPIAGIGFPRPYGAYQYEYDVEQDLTRYIDKLFIHNTYLGLWMWFGILGLLSVVVLIVYVLRAVWVIRHMRYRDASAPLAAAAGLLVLAVSSGFQTNLLYRPAYFAVAVGLACLDVWIAERSLPREQLVAAATTRPNRPVVRIGGSTDIAHPRMTRTDNRYSAGSIRDPAATEGPAR